MIDLVEAQVISGQIAAHLLGKKIASAELAERRKRSYRDAYLLRDKPAEFRVRLEGTTLSDAYAKGRHVCIETDGGYGIDIWDVYGKILYIAPGGKVPGNPPITLAFADGSRLIVLPGVWAQMRLRANEELRAFLASSDPLTLDASAEQFTIPALRELLSLAEFERSTIKEVLTKSGIPAIVGTMGAYSQEVLYRAKIHPKRKAQSLSEEQLAALHRAIQGVVQEALAAGGRALERDLFDRPGGFVAAVSQATVDQPCKRCGTPIKAINMGGAGKYYICPGCQVL